MEVDTDNNGGVELTELQAFLDANGGAVHVERS
jgi:hypothetical protein